MSRPRIVSIQTTAERGGAEYANVDMLEALRRRGHEVALATNLTDLGAGTGVEVQPIDLGPKLGRRTWPKLVLSVPLLLWRLARTLRQLRPVAVSVVHFKKEQLLLAWLPRRLTGRVVWMEWGPLPFPLRHGLPRRLYSWSARRAEAIMAISEGTRDTIVAAGVPPGKLTVVPNLIRVEDPGSEARLSRRRDWDVGAETFVIGCMSRLQRRKRNDVVIDAVGRLSGDVLLVLAGEGEEEDSLRGRAAGFSDRVRFVASVRGDVESFLSACDVLVFAPSPTEGEPRSIVVAQLMGLPVIATAPEGAAELIPAEVGTVVSPAHDPEALAAVLARYRDDPDRRRREGQAARELRGQSHDPERILAIVEQALGLVG